MKPDYSDVLARLRERNAVLPQYREPPRSATPESLRQALADFHARRALCGEPAPAVSRQAGSPSPKPKTGFFY
jgi:hypothetical protein